MMGVALSGPTLVYGDNMYVVHNTQRPKSVLKKKSNSICYHAVRESAAMGESIIGNVPSVDKPADICTKVAPGGQKQNLTVTDAYNLLVNYKQTQPSRRVFNDSEGVAFTTVENTRAPHPDKATIKCFACNKMEHYSNE
jgi:hypothetical protein